MPTFHILRDIRGQVRKANERVGSLRTELSACSDLIEARLVESELRTATAIGEVASALAEFAEELCAQEAARIPGR